MGVLEFGGGAIHGVLADAIGGEGCRALFEAARDKTIEEGRTIFSAGEPGTTLILIRSGRVEVSNTSIAGRKSVLAHMGPGEILGEIAALDGGDRSADAIAATEVEAHIISRENVMAFIVARPDYAEAVIIELCRKVRNASEMFLTQSTPEAEPRLARGLLRLFDQWGREQPDGTLHLEERFSQQDIGEFAGLARENVNRQIRLWAAEGILERRGRVLVLHDRTALETLSDA